MCFLLVSAGPGMALGAAEEPHSLLGYLGLCTFQGGTKILRDLCLMVVQISLVLMMLNSWEDLETCQSLPHRSAKLTARRDSGLSSPSSTAGWDQTESGFGTTRSQKHSARSYCFPPALAGNGRGLKPLGHIQQTPLHCCGLFRYSSSPRCSAQGQEGLERELGGAQQHHSLGLGIWR